MRREIKPLNLSVRDKNGSQSLGGGSLTVYETSNRIWLVFRPSGIEKHESRWYSRLPPQYPLFWASLTVQFVLKPMPITPERYRLLFQILLAAVLRTRKLYG